MQFVSHLGAVNRWGIPAWLEREVIDRDRRCVYCGVAFEPETVTNRSKATWEHIVNDATIIDRSNIARCCASCNASKGTKSLSDWFESDYCKRRGIAPATVADVVKRALIRPPAVHE